MKETVQNLAQENLHLRTENDSLKGGRKSTVIKVALSFMVLFLFAMYLISWGTYQQNLGHVQNSTNGETLVVNIALDGKPVPESGLKEKTIGQYGNINFNILCDRDDLEEENFAGDNVKNSGKSNDQDDRLKFGSSYLKRLEAMQEDIIPRLQKHRTNQTGTDDRIEEVLLEIHREESVVQDMKALDGNVKDLALEESEISQTFKDMESYLKTALTTCKQLKDIGHIVDTTEMYLRLADSVMMLVTCGQLTTDHFIKQSDYDVIHALQECDFYIILQRFANFMDDLRKANSKLKSHLPKGFHISNSSSMHETAIAGIKTAHIGIFQRIESKMSRIISNVDETIYIQKKVELSMKKLYNYLKPVFLKELRTSRAHDVIETLKAIVEAYAAVFRVGETI